MIITFMLYDNINNQAVLVQTDLTWLGFLFQLVESFCDDLILFTESFGRNQTHRAAFCSCRSGRLVLLSLFGFKSSDSPVRRHRAVLVH